MMLRKLNFYYKIELIFFGLFLFVHLTQQQTSEENFKLESGIIRSFNALPNANLTKLFYYINDTKTYEGVYLDNNEKSTSTNEIKLYLDNISKRKFNNLIDNNQINGSIERVNLIRSISKYLNLTETNLKLNSIEYFENSTVYNNKTLLISLSNIDQSLTSDNNLCKNFIKNLQDLFSKDENSTVKLLNERIYEINLHDSCDKSEHKVLKLNYMTNNATIELDDDLIQSTEENFLINVIIPLSIIGSMLLISIILACILYCLNKRDKKAAELKEKNPIYKQKSYLSKGVPVILYEEMAEKSMEEEDTSSGGHRMPLIMRNEKPPQPAPPEYRKQLSLQHLNDEQTINDIKNMLNNAPLASTEQVNDDTIPFLVNAGTSAGANDSSLNARDDLLFYQPPQPIATIKDVARRPHTTTNQNQTTQLLP